jgi:hypothetical protein
MREDWDNGEDASYREEGIYPVLNKKHTTVRFTSKPIKEELSSNQGSRRINVEHDQEPGRLYRWESNGLGRWLRQAPEACL